MQQTSAQSAVRARLRWRGCHKLAACMTAAQQGLVAHAQLVITQPALLVSFRNAVVFSTSSSLEQEYNMLVLAAYIPEGACYHLICSTQRSLHCLPGERKHCQLQASCQTHAKVCSGRMLMSVQAIVFADFFADCFMGLISCLHLTAVWSIGPMPQAATLGGLLIQESHAAQHHASSGQVCLPLTHPWQRASSFCCSDTACAAGLLGILLTCC